MPIPLAAIIAAGTALSAAEQLYNIYKQQQQEKRLRDLIEQERAHRNYLESLYMPQMLRNVAMARSLESDYTKTPFYYNTLSQLINQNNNNNINLKSLLNKTGLSNTPLASQLLGQQYYNTQKTLSPTLANILTSYRNPYGEVLPYSMSRSPEGALSQLEGNLLNTYMQNTNLGNTLLSAYNAYMGVKAYNDYVNKYNTLTDLLKQWQGQGLQNK